MKKYKNLKSLPALLIATILPTALVLAQSSAGFESSESFSAQSYDMNSPCVSCSEVSGTVGQISGEVMPAQVASGELAGTVNAQPVYSGGGGGGGFVPVAQQYATPTPYGGGYEMGTTSTTTLPMPGIPNTGLGDSNMSYLVLLVLMLIFGEAALLAYKRFKKI